MMNLSGSGDKAMRPYNIEYVHSLPVRRIGSATPFAAETLSVLTYNIGFASGPHQETLSDRHPSEYIQHNLSCIAEAVRRHSVDLLLLQEVDFGSHRTYFINQLQILQDTIGLPYATSVADWRTFVPFKGIGRVDQGPAILSRFPIITSSARLYRFNPRFRNPLRNLVYRPFVWASPIQHVVVDLSGVALHIFNVHLDVFQRSHRLFQFKALMEWVLTLPNSNPVIIAGDFNFQAKLRNYDGYRPEDDELPPEFQVLWDRGFAEVLSVPEESTTSIHRHVSFPELSKRLDYIFYSPQLRAGEAKILTNMNASDHLPVFARLALEVNDRPDHV